MTPKRLEYTLAYRRGMEYAEAYQFVLNKYPVSPYSVYHPDVINQINLLEPGSFNNKWSEFWHDYQLNTQLTYKH
jgi:hypothetical protein